MKNFNKSIIYIFINARDSKRDSSRFNNSKLDFAFVRLVNYFLSPRTTSGNFRQSRVITRGKCSLDFFLDAETTLDWSYKTYGPNRFYIY